MPSLPKPRFRRTARTRGAVAHVRPSLSAPTSRSSSSLGTAVLRWINIERPRPADRAWLEEHFDFHALDYEDVFIRNQRPKVDEYDDYLFIVLHFPRFDKTVGRLNAAELDVFVGPDYVITLPNEPLAAARVPVRALPHARRPARAAVLEGPRLPALQDRRRLRRRLASRCCARWATSSSASRTTSSRAAPRRDRARHLQRQAGDHQLPQDRAPAARCAAGPRAHQAATSPTTSTSTSTTSTTRPSASGTCSRTTRRSSRRSRPPTSRSSRTASTTSFAC